METMVGFSMSERSKNILPSNPNHSVKGHYSAKAECERNFQISEIGNVFAYNIGIKRVMNKRRPRLDSACLKDSKIPLYWIVIIVESCVSGGGKGLDYVFYGRHSSIHNHLEFFGVYQLILSGSVISRIVIEFNNSCAIPVQFVYNSAAIPPRKCSDPPHFPIWAKLCRIVQNCAEFESFVPPDAWSYCLI